MCICRISVTVRLWQWDLLKRDWAVIPCRLPWLSGFHHLLVLKDKKKNTSLLPVILQVTPTGLKERRWLKMTRGHVECYSSKSSTSLRYQNQPVHRGEQGWEVTQLPSGRNPDPKMLIIPLLLTTRPSSYTLPNPPHTHTHTHIHTHTCSEGIIKALICKWEPQ